MNKYIVIKKLDGYDVQVGDVVGTFSGNIIELMRDTDFFSTPDQIIKEMVSVDLLLAAGVIISADWKPTQQGEVFYVPNVTNRPGKRFTKNKFSLSSECHKMWVNEGICCYTEEQANSLSENMLASFKVSL